MSDSTLENKKIMLWQRVTKFRISVSNFECTLSTRQYPIPGKNSFVRYWLFENEGDLGDYFGERIFQKE